MWCCFCCCSGVVIVGVGVRDVLMLFPGGVVADDIVPGGIVAGGVAIIVGAGGNSVVSVAVFSHFLSSSLNGHQAHRTWYYRASKSLYCS